MKISLINIRDKYFYWSPTSKFMRRRIKDPYPGGKKHYVFGEPPLGIMYLSSALKNAGHEATLSDQCHPEYSDEKFVDLLRRERPEMVGISFLSSTCYQSACTLSRKIKAALPSIKVAYGGVFSTINAQKILASEASVDVVVRGDGEGAVVDLANNIDKLGDIPGIVFRTREGKAVETPAREMLEDLDSIPFPDRESLDINFVASLPLDLPAVVWDRPYTTLVSSRGCPFDCTYCSCPAFSARRYRFRSAANVLKELDEIQKQGYSSFSFLDDNFLLDPDRVTEICDSMISKKYSFKWACEGRTDPKANGVFEKLFAASCDLVMFGIESGSQRVLDSINKGTKLRDIEETVASAKKAGIAVIHGFFIVGAPGETLDEIKKTFDFAKKLKINSFGFNTLAVFRGTTLWNDAIDRGLIDEEKDWDKMFLVHAIYPSVVDSAGFPELRPRLIRRLIRRKIVRHPYEAAKIFRRLLKCMSIGDVYRLLAYSRNNSGEKQVVG